MSIIRSNYLFWHTNESRCLQRLTLEICGEKFVLGEGWRHITSKRMDMLRCLYVRSHTRPFLRTVIIRPREQYTVNHSKGFVCSKLGVAELKLEPSFALTGDGKIHISANENISAFWEDSFFVCSRGSQHGCRHLFWYTGVWRTRYFIIFTKFHQQIFIVQIKVLLQEGIAKWSFFSIDVQGKMVNFEIGDQSVSRVNINWSNKISSWSDSCHLPRTVITVSTVHWTNDITCLREINIQRSAKSISLRTHWCSAYWR
jgi:hypothetical protein